jgi:hypothetical protein
MAIQIKHLSHPPIRHTTLSDGAPSPRALRDLVRTVGLAVTIGIVIGVMLTFASRPSPVSVLVLGAVILLHVLLSVDSDAPSAGQR